MKDQTVLNITPAYFKSCFPDSPCVGFGDDFYILDATLKDYHSPISKPCRFDGFMLFYCANGDLNMSVNLTDVVISKGMVFINVPGNIICINEIINTVEEPVRYICMALSKEFFQGLNLEVCKAMIGTIGTHHHPKSC